MTAEAISTLSESGDPIDALSRMTPADYESLKQLLAAYGVQQFLRSNGWLNVFLGALTVFLGLSHDPYTTLPMIQTTIGVLIVGVSLWALINPQPLGIAAFSVLFLIAGIWNLYISLPHFSDDTFLIACLGSFQLWWAFRFYKIYRRSAKLEFIRPARNTGAIFKAIRTSLRQTSVTEQNNVVEFWINRRLWRGVLFPTLGIFSPVKRAPLFIIEKSNLSFLPFQRKTPQNPSAIHGQLNLEGGAFVASFNALSFSKYTRWKTNSVLPQPQSSS